MREHPCQQHRPGHHADNCLTGPCGFCGTDLHTTASGECRSCLRIVCEACDGGYQPDLGPICGPCARPDTSGDAGTHQGDFTPPNAQELHRLCVFELALNCGHLVTMALTGWYPVSVACCDRLGGTILHGLYVPYSSHVDATKLLSERYEHRPKGTPPDPDRLIDRRPRTDEPYQSPRPGGPTHTGRYPARVGAAWSLDGSIPREKTH
ncbi:hypothetical protein F6X54_10230 [Micromonospora aurantiaca]|uniref:TNFR-Cys domain-containing protein n=1 Tax=Micromonospora aurantiaca (nom. illeg.) TaxID=47850 RepID=A0ABQ6UJS5_9ACTN|nr:hypothetical protein [Micromonospora aurantiaca]KAB1116851.1 hypothetical protein F6X54_10230 [Micromonospora aurantiaca]